jgi:hypothetical protein
VSFGFKVETLESISLSVVSANGSPRPRAITLAEAAKTGDPDRILVVTKENPGFQYRGLFYPAGMEASEFAFWFGESDTGRIDNRWHYDKRGLLVSVEGNDVLAISFTVRDPQRPKRPPAAHIVTDSGIDHRSTVADVEKAHGKPTQVKDRGDGRKSLYYDSKTDAGGVRSVSFRFNGDLLEGIFVGYHPGKGPKPQATTVSTVTTKPTR